MPEKMPVITPPSSLPEEQATTKPQAQAYLRDTCPRCNSTDLAAGYLVDFGDKFNYVYLAPRRLSLSRLRNLFRPYRNLTKVDANICRDCGMVILQINIQEFAETEERFGRS